MHNNKEVSISYWAAHLTTIVSVTLVLLIIGIISLLSFAAHRETVRLKERIELSVVMADSVENSAAEALYRKISKEPYVLEASMLTKEQALEEWRQETGEDLQRLFGVNPLSPEISVKLRADYASKAEITRITRQLEGLPGVEGVSAPDASMVDSMNANIERMAWVLGSIALVLIVISFVLINNTVRLTIYSRRFSIHTMKLVGATNHFIRAPFMWSNILAGLIAGVLAGGILALALAGADNSEWSDLAASVTWGAMGVVWGGLVVIGVIICGFSAWMAATKYLHKDYDQLFK